MTKFVASIEKNIPTIAKVDDERNITPRQYLRDDERTKKSAIYHPPVKTRNHAKEYGRYNKMCGDITSWKAGVPMSFEDFILLPSDDSRKEYLQSILNKYQGITISTLSGMFNIRRNSMRKIIKYLGIEYDAKKGNHDLDVNKKFKRDVEAYFNDPEFENLKIERRKALPNLPRYTYSELVKMPIDRQRTYFYNIMDRYCHFLHADVLCKFFECSDTSLYRLMEAIDYKSPITIPVSHSLCWLTNGMDKRFEEEMLSKRRSFPSRKSNDINEAIENINIEPEVEIKKVIVPAVTEEAVPNIIPAEDTKPGSFKSVIDEVEEISKDIAHDNTPVLSDLGVSMNSLDLNITLGESTIFSDTFEKMIANMFGDKAPIKIKIEKL